MKSIVSLSIATLAILALMFYLPSLNGQDSEDALATQSNAEATDDPSAESEEITGVVQQWGEKLKSGGWTIAIQIALSLIGGAYAVGSFVRFRRANIAPNGLVEEAAKLWKNDDFAALESLATRKPSTLARVISFLATERNSDVADLTATAGDMAARELDRHSQRAYPLAIVATLEPLLGLLGTVSGMIESFDTVALAGEMGDASLLAGGISKALVTTLVGLAIAIPFLGLYHHFRSKNAYFTSLLEEDISNLIRHWFIRGRQTPPTTPTESR